MQNIDIVIAWVDGNDLELKKKRHKYLTGEDASDAVSATRFASNNEIYYNIASILKYVPFCRHIYVVADECFMGFCEKNYSVLSLLCDYDNLIVVRAFTKLFAIPGVRLGYMLSKNEAVRQKVQRNLPEWNVSVLAQMAGEACIRESEYIKETASYVSGQRRLLSDGLKKLGFKVYKSDADFILFYSKLPLYDILLNKGILIRDCSNYVGLSEGYFRVAVKTYDENVRLLKVIGECIEKN